MTLKFSKRPTTARIILEKNKAGEITLPDLKDRWTYQWLESKNRFTDTQSLNVRQGNTNAVREGWASSKWLWEKKEKNPDSYLIPYTNAITDQFNI